MMDDQMTDIVCKFYDSIADTNVTLAVSPSIVEQISNLNNNLTADNLCLAAQDLIDDYAGKYNSSLLVSINFIQHRDTLSIVLPLTIIYLCILLCSLVGNIITCTVIATNKSMHTATNYYLFNLAVSDLILIVSGLPSEIYGLWFPRKYPFTDSVCQLAVLLSETATNTTILTITFFTIERYIAICHPFRQHTMSKLSRAIKFIFTIWIFAILLALPQALQSGVVTKPYSASICTVKISFFHYFYEISSFIFFVGPMILICVLYVIIGIKLRKNNVKHHLQRRNSTRLGAYNNEMAQTRIVKMLIAVVISFFICWAPFHAQRLIAMWFKDNDDDQILNKCYLFLLYISGVLYFLSTCINPLLYNILSHKFRNAFKTTISKQCCCYNRKNRMGSYYSALSRCNGSYRMTTIPVNSQKICHNDSFQNGKTNVTPKTPTTENNCSNKNFIVSDNSQCTNVTIL